MAYVYIFKDRGIDTCCKIGTSSTIESRYRQARCHSPRGISTVAFYEFPTTSDARAAESAMKRSFGAVRRDGDATEWFNISSEEASAGMRSLEEFRIAIRRIEMPPQLRSADKLYDDWREQRPQFQRFKWRLFLFEEQSEEKRLKLSYGALYDTAYRYVFTYNPFPVRLIAGFEDNNAPEAEDDANVPANSRISHVWNELQGAMGNPQAEEVGWLRPRTRAIEVADFLRTRSLSPFDLARPKPGGAPPRETSVNPPIKPGNPMPLGRVRPSSAIYLSYVPQLPWPCCSLIFSAPLHVRD